MRSCPHAVRRLAKSGCKMRLQVRFSATIFASCSGVPDTRHSYTFLHLEDYALSCIRLCRHNQEHFDERLRLANEKPVGDE
jgi:hypothetical protein